MRKYINLDADEGIFFEKELESIKARTYDVLYPDLLARQLFPLDSTTDTGSATVTYQSWDHVGHARIIANYSDDLPNVEVLAKETTRKIYSGGVAYGYSIQDIRAARMAGKPLEQRKANAARRQLMQLENTLAFDGDARTDIPAFTTNTDFNQVTPVDGASTTTDWSSKTPDEIINDVCLMTSAIRDISNGVESPNTLLLPEAQYTLISCTPRSSTSDTTILDFILKSNAWISTVMPVYNLKDSAPVAAGYDSEDTAVLYDRSAEKLWLETPQDFESFAAQEKGLMFEVPNHLRTAGVIVAYPKSVATLYGI